MLGFYLEIIIVQLRVKRTFFFLKIRLFGGDEMSGRVEVLSNGLWQGICGIGWGLREAQVVCRQAGLGYPNSGYATAKFGTFVFSPIRSKMFCLPVYLHDLNTCIISMCYEI